MAAMSERTLQGRLVPDAQGNGRIVGAGRYVFDIRRYSDAHDARQVLTHEPTKNSIETLRQALLDLYRTPEFFDEAICGIQALFSNADFIALAQCDLQYAELAVQAVETIAVSFPLSKSPRRELLVNFLKRSIDIFRPLQEKELVGYVFQYFQHIAQQYVVYAQHMELKSVSTITSPLAWARSVAALKSLSQQSFSTEQGVAPYLTELLRAISS